MPKVQVEIELYCGNCGAGICFNGTGDERRGRPCFVIEPCDKCLGKAEQKGYEAGYAEGEAKVVL